MLFIMNSIVKQIYENQKLVRPIGPAVPFSQRERDTILDLEIGRGRERGLRERVRDPHVLLLLWLLLELGRASLVFLCLHLHRE